MEKIKLDRKRWNGCSYCDNVYFMCGEVRGLERVTDILPGGHFGVDLECFLFCPNCGRPLTEEAWAELERRIVENG